MEFKIISRQVLLDKATSIINKMPAFVHVFSYESNEWRNTKDNYIKENSLCELCLNEGNENKSKDVHHIVPISLGGEPLLEDNLIALCKPCHRNIHGSGIAIEIDDILSDFYSINKFTIQLININENLISQCKAGEVINITSERKPNDNNYVRVENKSGEHLGDLNPSDRRKDILAFDIVHGAAISAKISNIFDKNGEMECIIEISKGEVNWKEYDMFCVKDREAGEIIFQANTLEKTNPEEAVLLYRKAIEMLKIIDQEYGKYVVPWRNNKVPINRLSLILERQKRYIECLEEIEAYGKMTDKVGLYKGEEEKLEKRKERILKIINQIGPGAPV